MKNFSINVLRVGLVLVLGLFIFGLISHVEAATIKLDKKQLTLDVSEKKDVNVIISSASSYGIDPRSENTSIAKVYMSPNSSRNAPVIRIEAVGAGKTTIYVDYTVDGKVKTAECSVTVKPSIKITETALNLTVGETDDVGISICPASSYEINPKSKNASVAKVYMSPDSKRNAPVIRIEAIGAGKTTIEVDYVVDGMKDTEEINVWVTEKAEKKSEGFDFIKWITNIIVNLIIKWSWK